MTKPKDKLLQFSVKNTTQNLLNITDLKLIPTDPLNFYFNVRPYDSKTV